MSEGVEERSLKRRAVDEQQDEEQKEKEEKEEEQYDVQFRSYAPRDVKLQRLRRGGGAVGGAESLIAEVAGRVAALAGSERGRGEDVLSLAPKKAAWDLQRDLQPKLARLAHRLDAAVVKFLEHQQQHQLVVQERK